MSNATEATVEALLRLLPPCSDVVGGLCIEEPGSGKGIITYWDYPTCADSFINLPGINMLPNWLLAVMWGLFLLWAFFGVAVLSDAFVEGIEVITSKTKMVKRQDVNGREVWVEEPVWNWAVANITLLAVGSSSPEILLSLVETLLTLGKEAGEIGPSTIIGSGSYNLFGIIGICTLSLQAGVVKRIQHFKVFIWTTGWSLWAHIWLYIVYTKVTPNEIDIWESWVTLGFMPVFVWTTYLVDTRGWNWFGPHKHSIVVPTDMDDPGIPLGVKEADSSTFDTSEATTRTKHADIRPTIAYYRQLAVQRMAGGGDALLQARKDDEADKCSKGNRSFASPTLDEDIDFSAKDARGQLLPKVLFKTGETSVLESMGEARVEVVRMHGDLESTILVHYKCQDDTAVAGLDYEQSEGTLVFGPGETSKQIVIKIVDDDMSEPDVSFTVMLLGAEIEGNSGGEVQILRRATNVTIVDDDDGGVAVFELPTWEAGIDDGYAEVTVIRRNGADGKVTVDFATKAGTAVEDKHFKQCKGTITFNGGETRQVIQVPLMVMASSPDVVVGMLAFRIVLSNPQGGVSLGLRTECRVVLVPGHKHRRGDEDKDGEEEEGEEEFDLWHAWQDRFREAVIPDYHEEEENVWVAILLHYISITFKLIAACVPPAEWGGGYPAFVISLLILGALMAVVKEVAHMFGCAVGLSQLMNGMSIVAMGTSLPDTFASRLAAMSEDTADAAVGNIMGSNSCNVFLGLGIPWVIASAYYASKQQSYEVSAGSLGFSVLLFSVLAVVAISMLMLRRYQGGELGATTRRGQWIIFSSFIGLWLIFLIITGLYDYNHIPASSAF